MSSVFQQSDARNEVPDKAKRYPKKAMSQSKPITVLLVEDNPADAYYVKEILPVSDFQVVHASSMAAALQCLQDGGIDVILLDLSLPDSHGLDTVKSIAAHAQTIPIAILSGLKDEDVAVQVVQLGAQDFMLKDEITETVLSLRIHRAIELKHAEK